MKSMSGEPLGAEVILACGGSSHRMGTNKLLIDIDGKPCILKTAEVFDRCEYIKRLIISAPPQLWGIYKDVLAAIKKPVIFVAGGSTRRQSVMNAVNEAKEDIIVIHDGARPFVTLDVVNRSIEDACQYGTSIVCVPSKDTIRFDDGEKSYSPDRSFLYNVQTPQSFSRKLYLEASASVEGDFTDDAQILDAAGIRPHLTMGEYSNIKLTTKEDIPMSDISAIRIGHGYDVHRLTEGRKLILGGVEIPYEKGLLGHSDADVLTHALMDSLLGAAALGDIGKLFPDNDDSYKGADSILLLKKVMSVLKDKGIKVINCDVTVIAQAPKLAPFIDQMRKNLSQAMDIAYENVSVKATTEEHLGFTGSGEGIAAHAVSLISK